MNDLILIAIPSKTKLFLRDKLEKLNIEYHFYPYDTFQKDEDPQPFCIYNGNEYRNKKAVFLESTLSENQIRNLIKEIEKEQNFIL